MSENLNRPFCGCKPYRFENHVECSGEKCTLYGRCFDIETWNTRTPDTLKEKVEIYRNNLEQGLIWHSNSPYREGLQCAKERFEAIFGEKENGN